MTEEQVHVSENFKEKFDAQFKISSKYEPESMNGFYKNPWK